MTINPASDIASLQRRTIVRPDGLRLSVLVASPPDGAPPAEEMPPVLAVHGFASSAAAGWGRTGHLDALTRAGRTVIAPDLRGHGESDKPHTVEAYTLDAVLADVRAALEAGSPAPSSVDLLGYSLGARLCWTIACRGLLPVRRLVLGGFDGRPLFENVDTERLDRLAAGVASNDRHALRCLVRGLAGTGTDAGDSALPARPVLLVAGDADPFASSAERLAARLPDGAFLSVPGRNHISAVPAATFRRGVVEFLAQR